MDFYSTKLATNTMKKLKLYGILNTIISATFFPRKEIGSFYDNFLKTQTIAEEVQQ